MKISQLKTAPKGKPFVKTDRLEIHIITQGHKLHEMKATLDGEAKTFKVNGDPLKAWKQVEKFVGKIS